jgi:AraC family transcriptional regulator
MQAKPSPAPIQPSRFEDHRPMRLAGLKQRFTSETMNEIAALWNRFAPFIGKISGQVGQVAYGAYFHLQMSPLRFDCLASVEVAETAAIPSEFSHVDIPALRYAVFPHEGDVTTIRHTVDAIYQRWLPSSGYATVRTDADLPYMLERYGEKFNPQTASGDIEIWIPLQA